MNFIIVSNSLDLLVLIWVQTVCKGYRQTKKVAASKERVYWLIEAMVCFISQPCHGVQIAVYTRKRMCHSHQAEDTLSVYGLVWSYWLQQGTQVIIVYKSRDFFLSWSPNCSAHERENVPLSSSRGYFVSLWSSMELLTATGNTGNHCV